MGKTPSHSLNQPKLSLYIEFQLLFNFLKIE
nr:MAG TPA: hypothetical protein [Caudoviricetes sp.]